MILISELLSREAKEAETKSIVVELKLNDDDVDDDDFSSLSSFAVDITLLGMLMSGIVSEDDDDGMDIGSTQSDNEINDGDEGSESNSGDDEGGGTDQFISTFRLEVESDIEKRTTLMMIQ
eukprot:scaffold5294_cov72-Cyclotella_meneghiniana.AAC.13